ncbi:hypothetical protein KM043_011127 [Ampulex compressa]|nr:hypothetical protein KM043_011127 [Ampulex compressa]
MSLGAAVSLIEIDYPGSGVPFFRDADAAPPPLDYPLLQAADEGRNCLTITEPLARLLPGYSHFPRRAPLQPHPGRAGTGCPGIVSSRRIRLVHQILDALGSIRGAQKLVIVPGDLCAPRVSGHAVENARKIVGSVPRRAEGAATLLPADLGEAISALLAAFARAG